jgi:hypothetical protein
VSKHEISSHILNSACHEGLLNLSACHYVCWGRTIKNDLLFDQKVLAGMNGGLRLDHVVRKDRPGILQILKLVTGLEWRGATFVELLNHPTRLIEILVYNTLSAASEFLTNTRHSAHSRLVMHQNLYPAYGEGVPPGPVAWRNHRSATIPVSVAPRSAARSFTPTAAALAPACAGTSARRTVFSAATSASATARSAGRGCAACPICHGTRPAPAPSDPSDQSDPTDRSDQSADSREKPERDRKETRSVPRARSGRRPRPWRSALWSPQVIRPIGPIRLIRPIRAACRHVL